MKIKFIFLFLVIFSFNCKDNSNIIITTEPSDATVIEKNSNQEVGKTTFRIKKEPNSKVTYIIKFPNFREEELNIEVSDDKIVQNFNIKLTDLRNFSITTEPKGAKIDGISSEVINSPYKTILKPGSYDLVISKEGYRSIKYKFQLENSDDRFERDIKLISIEEYDEMIKLTAECEDKGMVFLDGSCKEAWSSLIASNIDWHASYKKCEELGMRLPYYEEIKIAYINKFTKSWESGGSNYWLFKNYWIFNINTGKQDSYFQDYFSNLRCHIKFNKIDKFFPIEWSKDFGKLKFFEAIKKCESLGMRLPTIIELKKAYDSNFIKDWENKKDEFYWSSSEKYNLFFAFSPIYGAIPAEKDIYQKVFEGNTKCVR